MKGAFCTLVVAVLIVFAPGQTSKDSGSGDEAAIRTLEQNFAQAVKAKDVDKIMSAYEHSAKLVIFDVIPPREYAGWDAYKKDWQDFLASFQGPITFEISGLNVTTVGNLAYGYSFQRVAGKGSDGSAVNMTVRVTDVYRKIDGKWPVVHEHVSVPVDLKTGKADLQSKP